MDIVHSRPSISPFRVLVKALRIPLSTSHRLSEVDLRVELDAGRVDLQLAADLGERLYSVQVSAVNTLLNLHHLEEIADRRTVVVAAH